MLRIEYVCVCVCMHTRAFVLEVRRLCVPAIDARAGSLVCGQLGFLTGLLQGPWT